MHVSSSVRMLTTTVFLCGVAACEHRPTEAGSLASLTVVRSADTLVVGTSRQFAALGYDANGSAVGVQPTWSIAAGGGMISPTGVFTAGNVVGTFLNTVVATAGSLSGRASVTVTAGPLATLAVTPTPVTIGSGNFQRFAATGRDAFGNAIAVTPAWSIVNGGGVIDSTGLFTAGGVGGTFNNTVRASALGLSSTATVTVFTSSPAPTPGSGPTLGAAASHGILAGSAVTCASAPGTINADASVWPGSAITGFPPCTITGARHAADAFAQTAQNDLTSTYNALDALACGTTITANLGGTTLAAGVYCSTSQVQVTGPVTLTGPASAVFVIKAASSLTTAGSVILSGGAQAKNVYWLVGSSATLGQGSAWQGNVIAFTSITLNDNVTLTGRALARNGAVTLGTNDTITLP